MCVCFCLFFKHPFLGGDERRETPLTSNTSRCVVIRRRSLLFAFVLWAFAETNIKREREEKNASSCTHTHSLSLSQEEEEEKAANGIFEF